jgi:hypothetical protein
LLAVANDPALGILDEVAGHVAVQALAIDAHRGGGDDAAHRMIDQPLEQDRGADIVGRGVALDFIHRLADADLGGEMDDAVDAVQRAGDCIAVADIGADEFGIGGEALGPLDVAMDLRQQAVEHPHFIASPQQLGGHLATDKAGTAGDQDLLWQLQSPRRFTYEPMRTSWTRAKSSDVSWPLRL